MSDSGAVAGIVLAGGRSSRMGTSKAHLLWQGRPLVEHMVDTLRQAGCSAVYISGQVAGYASLADAQPDQGPAFAMAGLLRGFAGSYDRLLFVPVDMPLLTAETLRHLLVMPGSVHFEGLPLPAIVQTQALVQAAFSVRELLRGACATTIALPENSGDQMINANTPAQWEALAP